MSSIQLGGVVRQLHRLAGVPAEEVHDGQLLQRFSGAGEASAFEALVRRHGPMVLGVCRRVLCDRHDADDAFQATFLVLLRRASSLDPRHSLAGWLYTVAYHVALKARAGAARRRRKEAAATPPAPAEPQGEFLWGDLRPVLDEELGRLPEQCRAPLVLCYLEGRTNEEAARLLRWPVGTVKSRLARGRDLLRTRLARRGVTLSAGALASAAVPAALAQHTLQAALRPAGAGAASPTAVALAEGALSTMSLARLKMVAAFLLLAGLAALGVGLSAGQAEAQRHAPVPVTADPPPAAPSGAKPPPAADKAAAPKATVVLAGRVVGDDGKPLAGARVAVAGAAPGAAGPLPHLLAETRTDREGKFRLTVRCPAGVGHEMVLAWAPDHGMAWRYPLPEKAPDLELKLPPEQMLRGRLIDLQGQPAAGVKLQLARLGPRTARDGWLAYRKLQAADPDDDEGVSVAWHPAALRVWLGSEAAGMGKGQAPKEPLPPPAPTIVFHEPPTHLPGLPATATTDAQGRFVLRGVGKGQAVGLRVVDERFALQVLDFPPRDTDEEVTRIPAPVRVLEGTVTDADTAQPVANARVRVTPPGSSGGSVPRRSESLAETDGKGRRGMLGGYFLTIVSDISFDGIEELSPLAVRTDAYGRFRLHLFHAENYRLRVTGPDGKHYLPRRASVSWPGEAVVRKRLDMTLQQGAVVRGRVTEAPGDKPLAGARVDFWCRGVEVPEGTRHPQEVTTAKDGTFRALLPPGSWHLLVNGPEPLYRIQKIGIHRLTDEQPPPAKGQPVPHFYPDALVAVALKPGAEREVAVSLRRAELLRGRVVGPDGKPVAGVYMVRRPVVPLEPTVSPEGSARRVSYDVQRPPRKDRDTLIVWVALGERPREEVMPVELRDGTFSIPVLDPEATYRLHFLSASGELGAAVELSGRQAGGEPVTVRLRRCGQATARIVDGTGKPLAGHRPLLWLLLPPGPHAAPVDLTEPLRHNLRAPDRVWAAYLDPRRHGDGPRSDAAGRVTLPALIPGATYQILLGPGKARDFTVEAGRTADLGELAVEPAALTERLPVVRPGK